MSDVPIDPCPRTDPHEPHWHGPPQSEGLCPGARDGGDPVPAAGESPTACPHCGGAL